MSAAATAAPAAATQSGITSWRLSQVFGGEKAPDEEIPEGLFALSLSLSRTGCKHAPRQQGSHARKHTGAADIVSCLAFDDTGEYLAAGDKGGRIVVFQRAEPRRPPEGSADRRHHKHQPKAEYKFFSEFQSHEAEFDYLKSMEIEEKINQVVFLPRFNQSHMLLTTNDKTVKLWKVCPKSFYLYTEHHESYTDTSGDDDDGSPLTSPSSTSSPVSSPCAASSSSSLSSSSSGSSPKSTAAQRIHLPGIALAERVIMATTKRVYANGHTYHINSIGTSTDQQTFLSADDLRINLWSLATCQESFSLPKTSKDQQSSEEHQAKAQGHTNRRGRHQTGVHARPERGHHMCQIPPSGLCIVCIQHIQRPR